MGKVLGLILLLLLVGCGPDYRDSEYNPDAGSDEPDVQEEQYGFCVTVHYCTNVVPVECIITDMWVPCEGQPNRATCKCRVGFGAEVNVYVEDINECPWQPDPNIPGRFLYTREGRWVTPPDCFGD